MDIHTQYLYVQVSNLIFADNSFSEEDSESPEAKSGDDFNWKCDYEQFTVPFWEFVLVVVFEGQNEIDDD